MEVLGAGYRGELHPIGLTLEEVSVGGWVSSPRVHRKSAGGIFIFVNNRHVRDRVVQHALFQGYFQRLVKGQFPLAALFIRIPFEQVDVNVHPTKTEVRFARRTGSTRPSGAPSPRPSTMWTNLPGNRLVSGNKRGRGCRGPA